MKQKIENEIYTFLFEGFMSEKDESKTISLATIRDHLEPNYSLSDIQKTMENLIDRGAITFQGNTILNPLHTFHKSKMKKVDE